MVAVENLMMDARVFPLSVVVRDRGDGEDDVAWKD